MKSGLNSGGIGERERTVPGRDRADGPADCACRAGIGRSWCRNKGQSAGQGDAYDGVCHGNRGIVRIGDGVDDVLARHP